MDSMLRHGNFLALFSRSMRVIGCVGDA
jgi:hypothetical protein